MTTSTERGLERTPSQPPELRFPRLEEVEYEQRCH
jgi:hypothetical protein